MAGIGIETNKVYPSSRKDQLHQFADHEGVARSRMEGGGAHSRLKYDEDSYEKAQSRMTLDDVRWGEMRKKIPGMGRVPKTRLYNMDTTMDTDMRMYHSTYIRENFKQKECQRFVPNKKGQDLSVVKKIKDIKCECGEVLMSHAGMFGPTASQMAAPEIVETYIVPDELKPYIGIDKLEDPIPDMKSLPNVSWTKEMAFRTTSAKCFGKINFANVELRGGKKPAKYVRISSEDSVDKLLTLMDEHWKIMEPKPPNLVISVVGGAKNCKLDGRIRETFSTGLQKAAKTTNAWLITSGFNMGVMKYVGMAVSEGQSFIWNNDRMAHVLRCIAIAPWGYVHDRRALECYDHMGMFNADYKTSNIILHGKPVPLNANHTHFVFVDDGYRNRYGGVAEFRAKFENKVQMPPEEGGLGIPVVLVVVEGGTDAIDDAKNSLGQNIPVVVCAGTGRAADLLSYAYQHAQNGVISKEQKLRTKIVKAYGAKWTEEKKEELTDGILNKIRCCMQKKSLMVDFHINNHEDLDIAILSVLLKAKSDDISEAQRLDQLKLALTWNRVDIAQEDIFREDVLWSAGSLHDILAEAIYKEKIEFVQLILQQGVVMKEFLTKKRLINLYEMSMSSKKAEKVFFQKCLRKHTSYDQKNLRMQNISELVGFLMDKYEPRYLGDDDNAICVLPYRELTLFAVLLLKPNLAKFAWEMGTEPVTSAVAISRMFGSMASLIHRNEQYLKDQILEYKSEFEDMAVTLLDQCHTKDHEKAMMLVERRSPTWAGLSSLQLAASAYDQAYLASVACQNSIGVTWKRSIASSWQRVGGALLCPFLVPFVEMNTMGDQTLNVCQRITAFYTAPITKFATYMMFYLLFLILFTYMLLVDFQVSTVRPSEIVCILWIFTFLMDDIYTMVAFPAPTLKAKFRDWIKGFLIDFLNYFLAFIGFFLHLCSYANEAKILYCFNIIIFYIRIMKTYTANRSLGPKLVMIKRMFGELQMFICVLIVFLLAYGIASQALLYKERQPSWNIMLDVFYYPYWQIYGEIYLEELASDDSCLSDAATVLNNTGVDTSMYCRQSHWLVFFFLAAYLIIGNVLLLNLLIAIFSNVFNSVQENSIEIWKYQMYYLTMEYDVKTALFPPFSIFIHFFILLKYITRKTCCKKKKKGVQFTPRHLEYLQLFEKEELTNILRMKREASKVSLETQVSKLSKRVEELQKLIEEEYMIEQQQLISEQTQMLETMVPGNWPDPKRVIQLAAKKDSQSAGNNTNDEKKTITILGEEELARKKREKKERKKAKREKKRLEEEKINNINTDSPGRKDVSKDFDFPSPAAQKMLTSTVDYLADRYSQRSPNISPVKQSQKSPIPTKRSSGGVTIQTVSDSSDDEMTYRSRWTPNVSGLNVPPGGATRRRFSLVSSGDESNDLNTGSQNVFKRTARESSTEDERQKKRNKRKAKKMLRRSRESDSDI